MPCRRPPPTWYSLAEMLLLSVLPVIALSFPSPAPTVCATDGCNIARSNLVFSPIPLASAALTFAWNESSQFPESALGCSGNGELVTCVGGAAMTFDAFSGKVLWQGDPALWSGAAPVLTASSSVLVADEASLTAYAKDGGFEAQFDVTTPAVPLLNRHVIGPHLLSLGGDDYRALIVRRDATLLVHDIELRLCWASLHLCAPPAERCGPDTSPSTPVLAPVAAPATIGSRTYYPVSMLSWPNGTISRPLLVAIAAGDTSVRIRTLWALDLSVLGSAWSANNASGVHAVDGVLLMHLFADGLAPMLVAVRDDGTSGTLLWSRVDGASGFLGLAADPRGGAWVVGSAAGTHGGRQVLNRLASATGEVLQIADLAPLGLGRLVNQGRFVIHSCSSCDDSVPVLVAGFDGGDTGISIVAAVTLAAVTASVAWQVPVSRPIGQLIVSARQMSGVAGAAEYAVVFATAHGVVGLRLQ